MATTQRDQSFLEIGRHCSEASCRQLDFLPFNCPSCRLPFCASHWRPPLGHPCQSYDPNKYDNRIPSCPLCSTPVPPLSTDQTEDPNVAMDAHFSDSCRTLHPDLVAKTNNGGSRSGRIEDKNECQVSKCHTKLVVVKIECRECRGQFCSTHRFPTDHRCQERRQLNLRNQQQQTSVRGKPFGNLFGSKSDSGTRKGIGQTGLAALRRAQVQARLALENNPASASIPSGAQKDTVRAKAATTGTSLENESAPRAKPKVVSKRAQAEQASQLQALEHRYRRGLLSENDKIKYAQLQAEQAQSSGRNGTHKNSKDVCVIA
ncbi:AN1-type zinc finger protein [Sporobolomyces koalae]|uniref:AN1-type zinc finger protein n=1 Tax=Sporobolomyces koalae TaxID=500713 RepID=UPI00317142F3